MLPRSALTARVFDTATRGAGCRLDAYRIDETFNLDIDLPGIDPAGIDVTVDRNVLTIRAERKHAGHPDPDQAGSKDPVTRQILLAESLDTDRLEARYENGVLTLRIPVLHTDAA